MIFNEKEIRPVSKHQVQDFPGGGVRYITEQAGITQTIVNGEVVIENGKHTGEYPGLGLRPVAAG